MLSKYLWLKGKEVGRESKREEGKVERGKEGKKEREGKNGGAELAKTP